MTAEIAYSDREILSDLREAGPMLYLAPPSEKACILCAGTGERVIDGHGGGHRLIDCNVCDGAGRVSA